MAAVTLPTDSVSAKFPTIGSIISAALPYVYVIAGLILLLMLISGGITLMTAAGDQNKTKEGYGKIQSGLVGFLIIFVAYFVTQIFEKMLGIKIF
jgi:uncharacterized membrane protein